MNRCILGHKKDTIAHGYMSETEQRVFDKCVRCGAEYGVMIRDYHGNIIKDFPLWKRIKNRLRKGLI